VRKARKAHTRFNEHPKSWKTAMTASTGLADIDERLWLQIADYSGRELSVAGVLCDRHDPASETPVQIASGAWA
jgi:hypothetical protein